MLSLTRRLAPSVLQIRRFATAPPPPATPPPRNLSEGEQVIHSKLTDRFSPSELLVQDVSGTQDQSFGSIGAHYSIH